MTGFADFIVNFGAMFRGPSLDELGVALRESHTAHIEIYIVDLFEKDGLLPFGILATRSPDPLFAAHHGQTTTGEGSQNTIQLPEGCSHPGRSIQLVIVAIEFHHRVDAVSHNAVSLLLGQRVCNQEGIVVASEETILQHSSLYRCWNETLLLWCRLLLPLDYSYCILFVVIIIVVNVLLQCIRQLIESWSTFELFGADMSSLAG
jgi:hypothetical protein